MTPPIRIRKSKAQVDRPWRVRYGRQIIGAFPTGAEALDFTRRVLRAAS